MTRDECWDDWEPGDTCEWEDDSEHEGPFVLTRVDHTYDYCYWNDKDGNEAMTRSINLLRIAKGKRA